jgi:ABC-type transporter Mla subunit MlaD
MAWKQKFKSLFVVDQNAGAKPPVEVPEDPAITAAAEMSTDELLASYEVPKGAEAVPLPAGTTSEGLSAPIDFQALYDLAGIPNTDEVELLEKFLGGLDANLPQASRIAASKAFLGAIGKSTNDVFTDAARKIQVVRAVDEAKAADIEALLKSKQGEVDGLQQKIDELRSAMEAARKDLESVKTQSASEEARLQGARVFFGYVEKMIAKT